MSPSFFSSNFECLIKTPITLTDSQSFWLLQRNCGEFFPTKTQKIISGGYIELFPQLCNVWNGWACSSTPWELILLLLDFIYMVNFMCFSGLAQNITAHLLYDTLRRTCGKLKAKSFSVSRWELMFAQKTCLFLCKLKNILQEQRRLGFQNRLSLLWLSLNGQGHCHFCLLYLEEGI